MFRLQKHGIVREVETQAETDHFAAMGYTVTDACPFIANHDTQLAELTVKSLKELCTAREIKVPSSVTKSELLALLTEVGAKAVPEGTNPESGGASDGENS